MYIILEAVIKKTTNMNSYINEDYVFGQSMKIDTNTEILVTRLDCVNVSNKHAQHELYYHGICLDLVIAETWKLV